MKNTIESSKTSSTPPPKKGRVLLVGTAIVLLLLIPTAFFIGRATGAEKVNKKVKKEASENMSIEKVQLESDSLYRALQGELEFYKSQADSLYPEVSVKEEELEKQYIRIQSLIKQTRQGQVDEDEVQKQIAKLKQELNRLRTFVDDQTLDLAEMRRKNIKLTAERSKFKKLYETEQGEKKRLADEYKDLSEQTEVLNEQVNKAATLQITNLSAIGAKLTTRGKDKTIRSAKRTEFMKICFDVVRNDVVRPGINKFYMRIIDPSGWPIVVESRGSAKIANVETGTEEYYTTMKSFNYNSSFEQMCMTWSQVPSKPFEKGVYHIEVFNKGYRVGKTTLKLN